MKNVFFNLYLKSFDFSLFSLVIFSVWRSCRKIIQNKEQACLKVIRRFFGYVFDKNSENSESSLGRNSLGLKRLPMERALHSSNQNCFKATIRSIRPSIEHYPSGQTDDHFMHKYLSILKSHLWHKTIRLIGFEMASRPFSLLHHLNFRYFSFGLKKHLHTIFSIDLILRRSFSIWLNLTEP